MVRRRGAWSWGLAAAAALLPLRAQEPALAAQLADPARWQVHEFGLGVTLRRGWFGDLLGRPQSVCVLAVDRREAGVRLQVVVPDRLTPTSVQAARRGALAAVNGGFFLPDGRPRGLRRAGGQESSPPSAEAHATVGWTDELVRFGRNDEDWSAWPDVLEAGPRLVVGGAVVDHGAPQRKVRHPRTALGERADGTVLMVTVDGRTRPAAGMTLDELGALMQALGCRDAINLDGGGSTTLWAGGFLAGDGSRIANHPCDDKAFDAAGERAVADVVLVDARAVVQRDDVDATDVEGLAQWSGDGTGQLGAGFLWAPAGEPLQVAFRGVLPRGGRYEVQRRAVVAPGIDGAQARFHGRADTAWFDRSAGTPADGDRPWAVVGTLRGGAGSPWSVVADAVPGQPFLLDAIRLVELPD